MALVYCCKLQDAVSVQKHHGSANAIQTEAPSSRYCSKHQLNVPRHFSTQRASRCHVFRNVHCQRATVSVVVDEAAAVALVLRRHQQSHAVEVVQRHQMFLADGLVYLLVTSPSSRLLCPAGSAQQPSSAADVSPSFSHVSSAHSDAEMKRVTDLLTYLLYINRRRV